MKKEEVYEIGFARLSRSVCTDKASLFRFYFRVKGADDGGMK